MEEEKREDDSNNLIIERSLKICSTILEMGGYSVLLDDFLKDLNNRKSFSLLKNTISVEDQIPTLAAIYRYTNCICLSIFFNICLSKLFNKFNLGEFQEIKQNKNIELNQISSAYLNTAISLNKFFADKNVYIKATDKNVITQDLSNIPINNTEFDINVVDFLSGVSTQFGFKELFYEKNNGAKDPIDPPKAYNVFNCIKTVMVVFILSSETRRFFSYNLNKIHEFNNIDDVYQVFGNNMTYYSNIFNTTQSKFGDAITRNNPLYLTIDKRKNRYNLDLFSKYEYTAGLLTFVLNGFLILPGDYNFNQTSDAIKLRCTFTLYFRDLTTQDLNKTSKPTITYVDEEKNNLNYQINIWRDILVFSGGYDDVKKFVSDNKKYKPLIYLINFNPCNTNINTFWRKEILSPKDEFEYLIKFNNKLLIQPPLLEDENKLATISNEFLTDLSNSIEINMMTHPANTLKLSKLQLIINENFGLFTNVDHEVRMRGNIRRFYKNLDMELNDELIEQQVMLTPQDITIRYEDNDHELIQKGQEHNYLEDIYKNKEKEINSILQDFQNNAIVIEDTNTETKEDNIFEPNTIDELFIEDDLFNMDFLNDDYFNDDIIITPKETPKETTEENTQENNAKGKKKFDVLSSSDDNDDSDDLTQEVSYVLYSKPFLNFLNRHYNKREYATEITNNLENIYGQNTMHIK